MMKHKDFSTCRLTPLKAIKLFCYWCVGSNRNHVKECKTVECPLFPYRFGRLAKDKELVKDLKIVQKWLETH